MKKIDTIKTIEYLFKQHYSLLTLTAFNIVTDKDAAKDIVQDFFVWYCQNHSKVSLEKNFKVYANKAVKNLSYQYLKKNQKKVSLLNTSDLEADNNIDILNLKEDNKALLDSMLKKLPEARRNIFISYVVQGMSYAEIAETYNISINTVKTQMKRAYSFFKTQAVDKTLLVLVLLYLYFFK